MTAGWTPKGLIAVDKQGDRILFLDPETLETLAGIENMPTLPHELAISPDRQFAFVPAYGDGVHGDNPHPNHLISVIDLHGRRRDGDIDLSPLNAPHTLRFGADGLLYICCENSGAIAVVDPARRLVIDSISTGSSNTHRLAVLSGRKLICTDNEEDASISLLDMVARTRVGEIALPCAIAGIANSADEQRLIVTSAEKPEMLVVNIDSRSIEKAVRLNGHNKPSQVVRMSPDDRWLLVVGDHEPVVSLFDREAGTATSISVGEKPMDGCFHPDGRTLLIANEKDATISLIDLEELEVRQTVPCGQGCETLGDF